MIRTKGEAGTGNVIEAVRHQRIVRGMIKKLMYMDEAELQKLSEEYCQSYVDSIKTIMSCEIRNDTFVFEEYTYEKVKNDVFEILKSIKDVHHRLPVVNFAAGGIATPADAAIMMRHTKALGGGR